MTRISGLSAVPLNEPKPLGFSDLHRRGEAVYGNSPMESLVAAQEQISILERMMQAEQIVLRLRAALKVFGLTTEEIDSIATDSNDGVRVSQYFEGKLTT